MESPDLHVCSDVQYCATIERIQPGEPEILPTIATESVHRDAVHRDGFKMCNPPVSYYCNPHDYTALQEIP